MRKIDELTMAYNDAVKDMCKKNSTLTEAQKLSIRLLEQRGFNTRSVLGEGNALMIKTGGGSHVSAEVAVDGTVNGVSVGEFLLK